MSEETNTPDGATTETNPAAPVQPHLRVLGQFTRDLSFENVLAQKEQQAAQVQPDIQLAVNIDIRKRQAENQYEVILKFKVTSKNKTDDSILFLLELEYGGVFLVENAADSQLHPLLMIEGPRLLFPYVRRIIADVTHDGGFPALNVDNIDFVALYRQEIARRTAQAAAPAAGAN